MSKVMKGISALISLGVLIAVTVGIILLADADKLPFMPEEVSEISYDESIDNDNDNSSFYDDESNAEISFDESREPDTEKSEESGVKDYSEEPKNEKKDVSKYLSSFKKTKDYTPSGEKYSAKAEKIVLSANLPSFVRKSAMDSLEIRMGYVFTGGITFDYEFDDISETVSGLYFSGERDKKGRPLFTDGEKYYFTEDGFVFETDFVYETDSKFVSFDYPSYFGINDTYVVRAYNPEKKEGKRYGYSTDDGEKYVVNCVKTFEFSTVPCPSYDSKGNPLVYGIAIKTVNDEEKLQIYSDFFYSSSNSSLIAEYYPAKTDDIYSVGYYYIDDGYTRVRIRGSNGNFTEGLVRIMNNTVSEVKMVSGYDIVSYSDGIILVRGSDGKYGFMTNTQNWITDPIFAEAYPFFEGLAVVSPDGSKWGVIDTDGNYAVEPIFDRITNCSGGIFGAYDSEYGWSVFVKVKK